MFYYTDTMQHKAIKLMGKKLAVAAIIEGGFSEEGLAAMSQCDDMTSMMAKELMLGIKDSVDDVSSAFKRMAFIKPQKLEDSIVIFVDTPVSVKSTPNTAIPSVEFTFGGEKLITLPKPKAYIPADNNQFTLFEFLEEDHDFSYQEKRAS